MDILSKLSLSVVLFLLTVAFGFWLSHLGKPYNGMLFNMHKLLALAAVVLTARQFPNIVKSAEIQGLIVTLLVATAICVVGLFASGALMSLEKQDYHLVRTGHRIAAGVSAAAFLLVVYWLR